MDDVARRGRSAEAVAVAALAAALCACASAPAAEPHAGVSKQWGKFLSMPHQRAFALAGDPDGVWVGATVGGYRSPMEAEREALKQCEQRRAQRKLASECRLYATSHQIVWDERPEDSAP